MGTENALIPTRFLLTMMHFIVTMMVFYTKESNVITSLPSTYSTEQFDAANQEILIALWLSVTCFAVEFVGLLSGFSISKSAHNAFYVVAHFLGAILLSWFALESWHIRSFWYLWAFLSLLPAIAESLVLLRTGFRGVVQHT